MLHPTFMKLALQDRATQVGFVLAVLAMALYAGSCSKSSQGADPATANMVSADQAVSYQQGQPDAVDSQQSNAVNGACDPGNPACAETAVVAPDPPPPLPDYSQPECPGDDYIWTPGYWAYNPAGYYWVPGVWVEAPYAGALWTPPYWAFVSGRYYWHAGYWGPHVGFYGGINYGFGYTGLGFYGGYWHGGVFVYNRDVANVNVHVVRNVYSYPVKNYTPVNRISFNGGAGGIDRRPVAAELAVRRESHSAPVAVQLEHMRSAEGNRAQFAAENHGRPAVTAVARPVETPRSVMPQPAGGAERRAEEPRPNMPAARQPEPRQAAPQPRMPEPRSVAPAVRQEPQRNEPQRSEPQRSEPQRPAPQPRMAEPRPAAPAVRPEPQRVEPQRTEPPHPAPEQRQAPHPAPQPQHQAPPQRRDGRGGE